MFSSAVLAKVASVNARSDSLSLRLAAEKAHDPTSRDDQLPVLILAHQMSLRKLLDKRDTARAQFADFSDLLALRQRGLIRRQETVTAAKDVIVQRDDLSKKREDRLHSAVRGGWTGNTHWLHALLGDTEVAVGTTLLSTSLEGIWRRVQAGRLHEVEGDSQQSALQELDAKLRIQQSRLKRWKEFSKKFRRRGEQPAQHQDRPTVRSRSGIDLSFLGAEQAQRGRADLPGPTEKPSTLSAKYATILRDMQDELHRHVQPPSHRRTATTRVATAEEERRTQTRDSGLVPSDISSKENSSSSRTSQTETSGQLSVPESVSQGSYTRLVESAMKSVPELADESSDNPSQRSDTGRQTIDEDREAMGPASPPLSPMMKRRHVLSLAERTRLSMTRRGSQRLLEDEEDENDDTQHAIPVTRPTVATDQIDKSDHNGRRHDHEDLATRTRRSMAGYEAARVKAQLERRRSQRKSKPALSIRKDAASEALSELSEAQEDDEGDTTLLLTESLLAAGGNDEEAVFKSRPKVKTSPMGTPGVYQKT